MEIYLLVLFVVIIISFVTGIFLTIYDKINLRNHIKNYNYEASLSRTLRIDALDSFGLMLTNNKNSSVEISLEPVQNVENKPPIPMPVVEAEQSDKGIEII